MGDRAIELDDFWERLIEAGIATRSTCQDWLTEYRQSRAATDPSSPQAIADFLVQTNRLTKFQRNAITADPPRTIRQGAFVIRQPRAPAPFGRFAQVEPAADATGKDGGNGGHRRRGMMLGTAADHSYLRRHADVDAPALQSYQLESTGQEATVFSELSDGMLLLDWMRKRQGKASRSRTCRWGRSLADAINALHQGGLVHGAVRADRVWVLPDDSICLLRDPSAPPGQLTTQTAWLESLEPQELYIAPECIEQDPISQTLSIEYDRLDARGDIYSLGCLLYQLAAGRWAFAAASRQESLQRQRGHLPKQVAQAMAQGENGDPLFRVLASALAKEPQSRYQDSHAFAVALQTAADLIQAKRQGERASVTMSPATPPPGKRQPSQSTLSPPIVADPPKSAESSQPPSLPAEPRPASRVAVMTLDPADDGDDGQLQIDFAVTKPKGRSRRGRKRRIAPWVLSGLLGVVIFQVIFLATVEPTPRIVRRNQTTKTIPKFIPPAKRQPRPEEIPPAANSDPPGYDIVDDRRLLYVPPRANRSANIPLNLMAPGPSMIVSFSGKVWGEVVDASSRSDNRLLPAWEIPTQWIVDIKTVAKENIDRVTVAAYVNVDGSVVWTHSLFLSEPVGLEPLLDANKISETRTPEGEKIYSGDEADGCGFIFSVDPTDAGRVTRLTTGPIPQLLEIAAIEGGEIPLPRALAKLWRTTDTNQDIAAIVYPNFLFSDGRELLTQSLPTAVDPLRRVLVPDTTALLMLIEENDGLVYGEIRASQSDAVSAAQLSQQFDEAIDQMSAWGESFLSSAAVAQRWRPLADRYPAMLRFALQQIRVGVSDQTAMANLYLPARAVPQLTLATTLALNTPDRLGADIRDLSPSNPLTVAQILDLPITVSFDQEPLEFALDAVLEGLRQELPRGTQSLKFKMIGGDLQKSGITQNQQIRGFAKSGVPLRTVLTDLMVAANSDQSAQGPADSRQKLVWVVEPVPNESQILPLILITTRTAAADKYELPREFKVASQPSPPK